MLSAVFTVHDMLVHLFDDSLDEELVRITVVLFLHVEFCLRLEFLADALTIGYDVVDAQLEVGKVERLGDIGISSGTVSLIAVFIMRF